MHILDLFCDVDDRWQAIAPNGRKKRGQQVRSNASARGVVPQ